jgi:hypothetical protein
MNTYENLQIVGSQFFTNMLIFVYIQSNSNVYWFISIRICCNEYIWIAIRLHSTIHNIWSAIPWAILNVALNYLLLPSICILFKIWMWLTFWLHLPSSHIEHPQVSLFIEITVKVFNEGAFTHAVPFGDLSEHCDLSQTTSIT